MKNIIIGCICMLPVLAHTQLYIQKGAQLHIGKSASIHVEGDLSLRESIRGEGTIVLGTNVPGANQIQRLSGYGHFVPRLKLVGPGVIWLTGDLHVDKSLDLSGGKLVLDGNTLYLGETAELLWNDGGGILSDGGGFVRKKISMHLNNFIVPLKNRNGTAQVMISTHGIYRDAYVEVRAVPGVVMNRPQNTKDHLGNYWIVRRSGIDGEVKAAVEPGQLSSRNDAQWFMYVWNGQRWGNAGKVIGGRPAVVDVSSYESIITAMTNAQDGAAFLAPNPAHDFTRLIIQNDEESRVQLAIVDVHGRLIRVATVSLMKGYNQVQLDVSDLVPGIYEINLASVDRNRVFKLVKQ